MPILAETAAHQKPAGEREPVPPRRAPMFVGITRMEEAAAAGCPFSPDAFAVAFLALNHLNDREEFRREREFIQSKMRRLSLKAITRALGELSKDGPFKLFERRRQSKGTNVYTFVREPLSFIEKRDAGRAKAVKTAATYYHEKKLELQRRREDFGGDLPVAAYEAALEQLHEKARRRSNGKVLPIRVLPR